MSRLAVIPPLTVVSLSPLLGTAAALSCLQPVVGDGVCAPGTSCSSVSDPASVKLQMSPADRRAVSLVSVWASTGLRACRTRPCTSSVASLEIWGKFLRESVRLSGLWLLVTFLTGPDIARVLNWSLLIWFFNASWMHHSHFFLWIIAPSSWNAFSLKTDLENMSKCHLLSEVETFLDDLIKNNYPLDPVSLAVFIFPYSMKMALYCTFCHVFNSVYLFFGKFHKGGDFIWTMNDFSVPDVGEQNSPPQNMSVLRTI